ncbi:MAG: hypothetical protein ACRDQA_26565 [Nocardioidaceae bacterium]
MAAPPCPGSGTADFLPYLALADGWPHGRVECRACGRVVTLRGNDTLRAHVPTAPNTEYFRTRKAALDDLRKERV